MMKRARYWICLALIILCIGFLYQRTHVSTIYGGDAGDLASAIITHGIPHPPGYPLYTLLGVDALFFLRNGTPAWRIVFLSHIPALLTLIFLFDTLVLLTKRVYASFVAVFVLAFLYPIWLYASVVEVFALNNFFIAILLWTAMRYHIRKQIKYVYAGGFLLGLSLTHHHIILFFVPTLAVIVMRVRKRISFKQILYGVIFFLLGLIPYAYVPLSAAQNPAVNWQGPSTVQNFVDLVRRAGYGTFKAGGFAADHPVLRLFDVVAFLEFVYKDFRPLGVVIIMGGIVAMWKKDRFVFWPIMTGILSYMFFLFYASFPLVDNFLLATYERFVQPLYVILAIVIGYGVFFLVDTIIALMQRMIHQSSPLISQVVMLLFLIYPLGVCYLNYSKISILVADRTAERLGEDILNSADPQSMILMTTDTPLFDTQYVYYAQKAWPDLLYIHYTKLYTDYYHLQLQKFYPSLRLPDRQSSSRGYLQDIIGKNYSLRPIFSKTSFATKDGTWIPYGLVFRYFRQADIPSDKEIYERNEHLWSKYQDPLAGSLGKYTNLMLSDVLRSYAVAHQETAFWETRHGYIDEGIRHLKEAEKLDPGDQDSYILLAQAYILKKSCDASQEQLEKAMGIDSENLDVYRLMVVNAKQCYNDQNRVDKFTRLYDEVQKKKSVPLHSL